MPKGGHGGDPCGHRSGIVKEGHLVRKRFDLGVKAFVPGGHPVVVLDPARHIARIGKGCGTGIIGKAADVIAVHVGQHHHIDLIGGIARRSQSAGDAFGGKSVSNSTVPFRCSPASA